MDLLNVPVGSLYLNILTAVFLITASANAYQRRIARSTSGAQTNIPILNLPSWTQIFRWLNWLVAILLIAANWMYGLAALVIVLILTILPVLEWIGYAILKPTEREEGFDM